MGANRGAIDAVVAAVGHDLSERDRDGLPDPGLAPASEPAIDRVPVAVFGRNITPGRPAAKPPQYAVDDRPVLLWTPTSPPVRRIDRQQTLQNTPFCFAQITPAQTCLQKEALNQPARDASTNSSTSPRFEPWCVHHLPPQPSPLTGPSLPRLCRWLRPCGRSLPGRSPFPG